MMHALLFFRKQILSRCKRSIKEQSDVHARLMSKYKQVPEWWYGVILSASVQCGELRLSTMFIQQCRWSCLAS